jgi:hypothetical protein
MMTEPKEVIDIRTPEVNVEEIMERIRERVQQRRDKAQAQGLVYDRLTDTASSINPAGRKLSSDFYYDLYQARQGADSIWVSLSVIGNNRYPQFLNSFITRLRHALHQLVIYYVNMLAGRQINFNRASIGAIVELAEANELMAERLEALEKEIEVLSERLAQYERESTKGEETI